MQPFSSVRSAATNRQNGWDSVRHVMNGTPLRKSRKLLPPEEGAQGEVPEKKEGKNLFY